MAEQRRNALERMVETFQMTSTLPEEMDLESPEMQAFLETLDESRKNNFLTMAKDPDVRKISNGLNTAMGKYWDKVKQASSRGQKTVFVPFNCSPEILYALDMVPVGVEVLNTMGVTLEEGLHEYLDLAVERGLPDTMCSAQRGVVGMMEAGVLNKPDMIINGALGSCDPNSKVYEYLSEKFKIPTMFLDIPYYHDDRSLEYYTKGYRQVVEALEELSGNKLDEERLREVCELSNRATEIYLEIGELVRNVPNPVPNYYNLASLAAKLTLFGTQEGVDVLQTAYDTCRARLKKGAHVFPEEKIRMMMMYTGIYFDGGVHYWLQEEMGVTYLRDLIVCYDFDPIIDTTNIDTMLAGLAEKMINLPMTRQMKGSWDMPANWLQDMLYYVETYKADCLVFTGHTACKQVWGIYRLVADEVKKQLGVPALRLEGDGWDSRITPMLVIKEQMAEFFETLS